MVRAKGLIILLAILFFSIVMGYFLVRINPNYPQPGNISEMQSANSVSASQQDWLEYSPVSKAFKVKLPVLPQTTSKSFIDPKTQEKRFYEMYVSEKKDGTVFLISIINFEDLKTDLKEDEMLTAVADDMLTTHPEYKLIRTEGVKFKGNPALEFQLGSDKANIDTLTFTVGKKLYVLNRVAPGKVKDRKEFEFFINSFDLTPKR